MDVSLLVHAMGNSLISFVGLGAAPGGTQAQPWLCAQGLFLVVLEDHM